MTVVTRRQVIRLSGIAALSSLGGCTSFFQSSPTQGSLIIENQDDVKHTVSVTAIQRQTLSDSASSFSEPVEAGQTKTNSEFLNDNGWYDITVKLDTGASATTEMEIHTHEGPGHYLRITVTKQGTLDLTKQRAESQ